jgi:hypothetical protein
LESILQNFSVLFPRHLIDLTSFHHSCRREASINDGGSEYEAEYDHQFFYAIIIENAVFECYNSGKGKSVAN